MTLHCSPNCTIAGSGMTGILQTNNCAYYPGYNVGCGITTNTTLSYGAGFNNNGGGNLKTSSLDSNTRLNQTRCLCDGMDLKLHPSLVLSACVNSKQHRLRNTKHHTIWNSNITFRGKLSNRSTLQSAQHCFRHRFLWRLCWKCLWVNHLSQDCQRLQLGFMREFCGQQSSKFYKCLLPCQLTRSVHFSWDCLGFHQYIS